MTPCGLPAAMDSSPPPKATSPMKLRRHSRQNTEPGTKNSSSKRRSKLDSYSEEVDAKDAGAMTLCGLLAALDSSPPPKATPPMKLRRRFSHNTGQRTKKSSSTRQLQLDSEGEVSSEVLENDMSMDLETNL